MATCNYVCGLENTIIVDFLHSSDNVYNFFIVEYCDNLYNYNLS